MSMERDRSGTVEDSDIVTVLDEMGLARRMSGSQELLDMFLDLFKNQFPETLQRLEAAVETGDCGAVMREAHTIKSLLQNFFVGHLVRLIHEVEIAGRQLDLSTAQARFASFKYELQRCEDMMIRLPTLKLTAV